MVFVVELMGRIDLINSETGEIHSHYVFAENRQLVQLPQEVLMQIGFLQSTENLTEKQQETQENAKEDLIRQKELLNEFNAKKEGQVSKQEIERISGQKVKETKGFREI
jgi:cob(I)alamin adenosyltransferase